VHAVLLVALAGYGALPARRVPDPARGRESLSGRRARREIVAERLNAQLADASRARRGADASAAARAFRDMERSPVVR